MLDFGPRPKRVTHGPLDGDGLELGDAISAILDAALVEAREREYAAGRGSGVGDVAKNRIGSGYIGVECARELAYRFHKTEKERRPSKVAPGELTRHGEAGHWTEARTAEWLRLAGFDLSTERPGETGPDGKPKQHGYLAARDPETGQARLAGEVDGVILALPPTLPGALAAAIGNIKPPCIWESKKATDKKWKKFQKDGVAKADPKYYGQLQTNMAYMGVEQTLFSMLNLDNMKYYWELVLFDVKEAQRLTDRAVNVFRSNVPEELPRIARDRSDFRCKFCDYPERCWSTPVAPSNAPAAHNPAWLTRA